ncbi:MAG: hypothetical protein IPN69_09280 [Acidobacteria bacterium]|nr:hypothetical protein [Acidobacteriota bacterium]
MNQSEFQVGVIRPIECVKEAFELIKADYWLLFAVTLVGALIGGMTMYILLGAMMCGMFYCYLERIDGRPVVFDGLWKGFQWWLPGLIVGLAMIVPMIIVYVVLYLPIIAAVVMGSKLSEGELIGLVAGAFGVDLVLIVAMVCFHTLLMFSFPLIVDRNLGAFAAMSLSARAVWNNLGGVAGLYGVGFVLSLAGMLAFCVGIYFVIPIIIAGNVLAYRKVFPAPGSTNVPPAPNVFQDAGTFR